MAAPAAAPTAVPTAAPVTVAVVAAAADVVPVCPLAQSRHWASSSWNSLKLFPVPGSAMTLGPGGAVAQPTRRNPAKNGAGLAQVQLILIVSPSYSALAGTLTHCSEHVPTLG